MAKSAKPKGTTTVSSKKDKSKVSRPGIHAKTKSSKLKSINIEKKIHNSLSKSCVLKLMLKKN